MDPVNKALEMMIEKYEKDHGRKPDLKGHDMAGVFNDAVVVVGLEDDGGLKVSVVVGKPDVFDYTLGFLEGDWEQ